MNPTPAPIDERGAAAGGASKPTPAARQKLVIQVPCFNEAATIGSTLADLPASLPGVGNVEVLVIDDGSGDGTSDAARRSGAQWIVRHSRNRGLAKAFSAGLEAALKAGADLIVQTDADGQYFGADIRSLVEPILTGRAEMGVGERRVGSLARWPRRKRWLSLAGSWVVRRASGTEVHDAASGFRAYSREAALRVRVDSQFSYTLESLIHAGWSGMRVVSVPVRSRATRRPSRLYRTLPGYVLRSAATIARSYLRYHAATVCLVLAAALAGAGALVIWFEPVAALGASLMALLAVAAAAIAEVAGANMRLVEEVRLESRRRELGQGSSQRALDAEGTRVVPLRALR